MATKGRRELNVADFSKMTVTEPGLSTPSISSVRQQFCSICAKIFLTLTSLWCEIGQQENYLSLNIMGRLQSKACIYTYYLTHIMSSLSRTITQIFSNDKLQFKIYCQCETQCININDPSASTYDSYKTDCNEIWSKANSFHTFSNLSPCDNSLQATDVWYCDGMTHPFTLLKPTALEQEEKKKKTTQPINKKNKINFKKSTSVLMFSLVQHGSALGKWSQGLRNILCEKFLF